MKYLLQPIIFFSFFIVMLFGCSDLTLTIDDKVTQRFHVLNDDYPIPVLVRGNTASGTILLYVQGGPGLNSLDFAEIDYPGWKNTLESEYAVAYYDQRGLGNGAGEYDDNTITLDTWIEDLHQVASFLKKAYNAEIVMMGHSFGGRMIYQYILEHADDAVPVKYISINGGITTDRDSLRWVFRREFLFKTAMLEITNGRNTDGWYSVIDWLNETPVIQDVEGNNPWRDKDQWNAYVEDLVYPYYPESDLSIGDVFTVLFASSYNPLDSYIDPRLNSDLVKRIFENMYDYNLLEKFTAIDKDMLLITGRYDDICPPCEMQYVFDSISSINKRIEIVENAGHESFIHQPDEFFTIVKSYVDGL
ncbi:alpha/beta fold hydrolase [Bacteroidota bacterium]